MAGRMRLSELKAAKLRMAPFDIPIVCGVVSPTTPELL
jgi:hypothetical protein